MKVIILSAGQGRRLLPLTESRPKCSLPINGRPLLEWQLREISLCAVDEVVIATGYEAGVVEEIVAGLELGDLRIRTEYNPFFEHCDNLGTCWLMRHEMRGEFVVLNGDTLFEAQVLQRLLAERVNNPITLVADHKGHYDDDDMLIVADGKRLQRVGKRLGLPEVNGESIGMLAFDATGGAAFAAKLDAAMRRREGLGSWYLSAVDALARQGHVGICSIHGLGWCEVDTRLDLARAEESMRRWPRLETSDFSVVPHPRSAAARE
jgi:choline kinase